MVDATTRREKSPLPVRINGEIDDGFAPGIDRSGYDELVSRNRELTQKLDALEAAHQGLQRLVAATDLGALFLDEDLRVIHYTPATKALWDLVPDDVGTYFEQVCERLNLGSLAKVFAQTARTFEVSEQEVQNGDRWFLVRICPEQGPDQKVAGVLITTQEITDRKNAECLAQGACDLLQQRLHQRSSELSDLNRLLCGEIAKRRQSEKSHRELQGRLINAQEEERGQIARELHDEIAQQVTALSLGLKSALDKKDLPQHAPRLLELARTVGHQIHQVAIMLRPPSLDDMGIVAALTHLVGDWSADSKIEAAFQSHGLEHHRLPRHIETTIYRIVVDALDNISKHAGASLVSVIVEKRDTDVVAIVEDNGGGFIYDSVELDSSHQRLGLARIKERAALIEGELTVETSPQNGTTLFVRLPLLPL